MQAAKSGRGVWRSLVGATCSLAVASSFVHAAPVTNVGAAQLWFDASQPATLFQNGGGTTPVTASGNPVGFWGNASAITGATRNATQATGTAQPTWQTNVINGKAVVRFDGTSDYLDTGAVSSLDTANLTWFTVSTVTNPATNSQNLIRTSYSGGAGANSSSMWGTFTSSSSYAVSTRDSAGGLKGALVSTSSGAATITAARWDGVTDVVQGWSNGNVQTGTTSGGNTGATASPTGHLLTRLGSNTAVLANNYLAGDIAEAMVFASVFNTAQRTVVENYLGAKYAINLANNAVADGNYQSLAASYRNDVIGIGKASDASASLSSGLSGLQLAATALTTNDAWVFAGNGDAYNSTTSIQTANALVQTNLPAGVTDRWSRVWNVETVNMVAAGDAIGLTFDWNAGGLGGSFDATHTFALLYSSTASPTAFARLLASQSSLDAANKTVTFDLTGGTLADGYYTVAVVPEPVTPLLALAAFLAGGRLAVRGRRRR